MFDRYHLQRNIFNACGLLRSGADPIPINSEMNHAVPQPERCSRGGGEVSFWGGGAKLLPFSTIRACLAIGVARIFD